MENELFLVRYYWSILRRHPLRWIVPMLAVIAIGAVVVFQTPRTYVSNARVSVQSPQTSGALVQSTVTNERVQFYEQRLFSRENLVALSRKLKLFPETPPGLSDGEVADMVRRQITLQVTPTDPNDPTSNSAILSIGFTASSPELAAAGATEVIQMLINENRTSRMSEANQLRTFLEQEVATRRQQAEGLDVEWNAFVAKNEALLPSRLALYTSEMQELQQELQTIQVASATLGADTRVLETQLSLAERTTSSAQGQLGELKLELSNKQTIYSETHPDIVSLKARIAALEQTLAQTPAPTAEQLTDQEAAQSPEVAMLNERITVARQQQKDYTSRRAQIDVRLDELRATIASMPSVEANLQALQRRHTAADANLSDMQSRLDTALVGERLENAQQDTQINVIDAPEVPTYATGTGRTRALMVVAALGLAFGLACLVGLDFLDRSIKSKRALRNILEGGALVLIPDWKPETSTARHASLSSPAVALALVALATMTTLGVPHGSVQITHEASGSS